MMRWNPLPKGAFTGIDWSRPDATNGFDPYLVWAEASAFAGSGAKKPRWLPLLIELARGVTVRQFEQHGAPEWLHVPKAYTSVAAPAGLRFCTARVGRQFFREIAPGGTLHGLIQRFELGLAAGRHGQGLDRALSKSPSATPQLLKGKVLGLIDGGLAFANTAFLRNGKARTRRFWRQDEKGVGRVPATLGYGHELASQEINAVMAGNRHGGLVDEAAVYAHFDLPDLRRRVNHGTHVADLACGARGVTAQIANVPPDLDAPPSWVLADDQASRCDIVAVQLDWDTVLDTSGGSMNVHVMDGLMYILSCCDASAKIAVNCSWGTLAGPHDGSSVLEAAMDQLLALKHGALHIVLSAGNSYQSRAHTNGTLRRGEQARLTWSVQPDDRTQSFLEIWCAARPGHELGNVALRVTPPSCAPLPWLRLGNSGIWTDGGGQPLCALIFPRSVATGTTGSCALLALAPSASFDPLVVTAPSGPWAIELRNGDAQDMVFDAYIERDDVPEGIVGLGGRQSSFIDDRYDTSGNPGSFVDDPANPTLIRRSGSFNSIATGRSTVSVGGVQVSNGAWARYSPRKPDPDHARAQRPGVVKVPTTRTFSDESPALLGLKAAGTHSGSVVRLVGTSSAAPQQTRRIFNRM